MKKLCFFSLIIFLIFSCEKDITVYIEKGPGTIVGQILPTGIDAFVEIRKSDETIRVNANADGYFKIEDLEPGHYNLIADAPEYGRKELTDIYIGDDEVYDIGVIELSSIPYPLNQITISSTSNTPYNYYLYIRFNEEMNSESVIEAIKIEPEVENISYSYSSTSRSQYIYLYFYLQLGTTYTFTLDTNAQTLGGKSLEFPYVYSYTTSPFKLISFDLYKYSKYTSYFRLGFNSYVEPGSLISNLTINPPIEVYTDQYAPSTGVYIYPTSGWMSDTTIVFKISKNFTDLEGNTLSSDTSVYILTDQLKVMGIQPYNTQRYVSIHSPIQIIFNNVIDESTIENALHITPEFDHYLSTTVSGVMSYLFIQPDSVMQSATIYTIEIDTSLTDYYGVNLAERFVTTFITK